MIRLRDNYRSMCNRCRFRLMSIATAHWNGNARDDINEGVARINAPQVGDFRLSRDFLLKAALLLAKIDSIAFNVSNFTLDHIHLINDQ